MANITDIENAVIGMMAEIDREIDDYYITLKRTSHSLDRTYIFSKIDVLEKKLEVLQEILDRLEWYRELDSRRI